MSRLKTPDGVRVHFALENGGQLKLLSRLQHQAAESRGQGVQGSARTFAGATYICYHLVRDTAGKRAAAGRKTYRRSVRRVAVAAERCRAARGQAEPGSTGMSHTSCACSSCLLLSLAKLRVFSALAAIMAAWVRFLGTPRAYRPASGESSQEYPACTGRPGVAQAPARPASSRALAAELSHNIAWQSCTVTSACAAHTRDVGQMRCHGGGLAAVSVVRALLWVCGW